MSEIWPAKIIILHPKVDDELSESTTTKEILLANEYGRNESVLDLKQHLQSIDKSTDVEIISISLKSFMKILNSIVEKYSRNVVILNLCDGTELDGYPGLSVVKELELLQIPFTGSGSNFFEITTSKPRLKQLLMDAKVPTSQFVEVDPADISGSITKAANLIKWPLIVKPSVSYASIAITTKSIVENEDEAEKQINHILETTTEGVFLESFLAGREFTALCTGSAPNVKVYTVAERVFNPRLKVKERILAFDKYWEGYDLEGGKGSGDPIYSYQSAPSHWQEQLKAVSKDAYIACGGSGYGRVDIRTRNQTDLDSYVLEVNANCGLSFEKDSSSLGEILTLAQVEPADFLRELVNYALSRAK